MFDFEDSFLTVKEVSAFLRITQSYVYYLLHLGVLPGIKVGYFWRIPTPALNQFIIHQINNPLS